MPRMSPGNLMKRCGGKKRCSRVTVTKTNFIVPFVTIYVEIKEASFDLASHKLGAFYFSVPRRNPPDPTLVRIIISAS